MTQAPSLVLKRVFIFIYTVVKYVSYVNIFKCFNSDMVETSKSFH